MKRFLDQTGIDAFLDELDLPKLGLNRGYQPNQLIFSFWLIIWTGASRYIHRDWLRYDSGLQSFFDFKKNAISQYLQSIFGKFSQKRNTEVFPILQNWFFDQLQVDRITFDFDSTVITRNGDEQGSAKGYAPNKRGRKSHHSLMAFVEQTKCH